MKVQTPVGDVTFDEFCFLVSDGQKADLIDGVIYMASPDNTDANEMFAWMLSLLNLFVQTKDLGKVYGSRVALRFNKKNAPEPDVLFVRKQRLHLVRRGFIAGAADLIMEIVSPESIERDYFKKRRQYQRFKVPEYWIIDEMKQEVTLLRLSVDGKYHTVSARNGVLRSTAVPGFWLRTEWLWKRPLPKTLAVLTEILG
jgi:Uma2 family endonuclease